LGLFCRRVQVEPRGRNGTVWESPGIVRVPEEEFCAAASPADRDSARFIVATLPAVVVAFQFFRIGKRHHRGPLQPL
jgi:hypothetical protein